MLTAVEDYLVDRPDLAYAHVPSVFGLGVVYPAAGEAGERLAALLAPFDRNPQLERLEQNRLALLLRCVELQDEILEKLQAVARRDQDDQTHSVLRSRVLVQDADRIAAAEGDNAALRLELRRKGGSASA